MLRVYIRLVVAVVWLVAAVFSAMNANPQMVALYALVGGAFLFSAFSSWKKAKSDQGE